MNLQIFDLEMTVKDIRYSVEIRRHITGALSTCKRLPKMTLCKFRSSGAMANIFGMVAIAVDLYRAVVVTTVVDRKSRRRWAIRSIIVVWLAAAVYSTRVFIEVRIEMFNKS